MQRKSAKLWYALTASLVVGGIIAVAGCRDKSAGTATQGGDSMMKGDGMMQGDSMMKGDGMMQGDGMMKGDSMMKENAMSDGK